MIFSDLGAGTAWTGESTSPDAICAAMGKVYSYAAGGCVAASSAPTSTPTSTPTATTPAATQPAATGSSVDLAGIQAQLNAAISANMAAQQSAAQAASSARVASSAAAYASAAASYASQANTELQSTRAAANRRDLQSTTISSGRVALLASQARGQADLANQAANAALRGGTADPFATGGSAVPDSITAQVTGAPGTPTRYVPSGGGGKDPRYVEMPGDEEPEIVTMAPIAVSQRERESPLLVYVLIGLGAYLLRRA